MSFQNKEIRNRMDSGKSSLMMPGVYDPKAVDRPTVTSSQHSQPWTLPRQILDFNHKTNMVQFLKRPYMNQDYPELPKHYPGAWTVVSSSELDRIVARVVRPTIASKTRKRDNRLVLQYLKDYRQEEEEFEKKILKRPKSSTKSIRSKSEEIK